MTKLSEHFPLAIPRESQIQVMDEIEKAYSLGYKYVICEAPVGSGKSPIALTVSKWQGEAHILTPRKNLQDQYFTDFEDDIVLMKGRSSYFCTQSDNSGEFHKQVIQWVMNGSCPTPTKEFGNCRDAPCKDKQHVKQKCTTDRHRTCPYTLAIETAEAHKIIVHNFHSFIYQYHYAERFNHRKLLVVDEAHEIEGILRDFATFKFSINRILTEETKPDFTEHKLDYWVDFLGQDALKPRGDKAREEFAARLEAFKGFAFNNPGSFITKEYENTVGRTTLYEFIPVYVGNFAQSLLFSCADKILLMSGTIYNKDIYCNSLGIKPDEAYLIRIGSSFPVVSRPIYMKDEYMIDTSHAHWEENKDDMIEILKKIISKFPDAKGLIHVPSYKAAQEVNSWLKEPRLKLHTSETFSTELEKFYKSKQPLIFVSPICQQGVDFKDDRARFQVIMRVPYLNTGDKFVEYQVKNNFPWYNHQALVAFGQQIGRINRSEEDFGVTILMDERFKKFVSRNKGSLPKWLTDSIKR